MRRRRGRLLATLALLTAACALTTSGGAATEAPSGGDGGGWGVLAAELAARAEAQDQGNGNAFTYASLAYTLAHLSPAGWKDPQARAYLRKVMALRNPDGGWGLRVPFDAFADGSTNPATTTYTVTQAVHVGMVLLDAYRAGAVGRPVVEAATRRLLRIPLVPVPGGFCVAYSAAAADDSAGYCVHNVNAGAAMYLRAVQRAGLPSSALWIRRITAYETRSYDARAHSWRYRNGKPALNDASHNALSVEAMLSLGSPAGARALRWYMAHGDPSDPRAFWIPLELASWDCRSAARRLPEIRAGLERPAVSTEVYLAQAARAAARAAAVCDH